MNSLPILLKPQKILLIGGGNVAYQKANVLIDNNIPFKVIAKKLNKKFKTLQMVVEKKDFSIKDIQDYKIIIDATGNEKVTKKILNEKEKKFFLLNVVDVPHLCDFYFSSLINYGHLKIAVSTNGASPRIGQMIRDKIKNIIPNEFENLLNICQDNRLSKTIDVKLNEKKANKLLGHVSLIGCGLGDPELLTIKAFKAIQNSDVILYDNLVSQEVLDLVPNEVKKIYVGKEVGNHLITQDKINAIIIKYLAKGLHVSRLKSGDPLIFGRGYEEANYCIENGYRVDIINGISSAVAGVSYAGIPLTQRGVSSGFSVVTAHLKDKIINLDWLDLLHRKEHTVVVLMGLSFVKYIYEEAKKRMIHDEYPIAIISNASRTNQETKITTLKNLKQDAKTMQRPAILVFGNSVETQFSI